MRNNLGKPVNNVLHRWELNNMYTQLLANQRVTFVSDIIQAQNHSPFYHWYNEKSERYVVSNKENGLTTASGLSKEEAEACVMFLANDYIYKFVQKGN